MLTAKPTVQLVDVRQLRPWDRNPRTITEERFTALKRSLVLEPDHLRARPLVALTDGRVIAGNMRQRAAHSLVDDDANAAFLLAFPKGRVPTFVVDLPEDRATAWALRDNNEYGDWNKEEVAELLYELEQAGAELDTTGFTQERVTQLIDLVAGPERAHNFPDDPAPAPPKKPKSKPGQIWELGPHRLMCGDATKREHVDRLLDGAEPKLIVTDPPYGISLELGWRSDQATEKAKKEGRATSGRGSGRRNVTSTGYGKGPGGRPGRNKAGNTSMQGDTRADWSEAYALVPSAIAVYVFFADVYVADVVDGLRRIGYELSQLIVWDKLSWALSRAHYHWQHELAAYTVRADVATEIPWYAPAEELAIYAKKKGSKVPFLGDRNQATIWQAPSPKKPSKLRDATDEPVDHPTQKPTLVYTRPYTNHTRRGDAVYEPFGGSGSALIAAEMTSRRAFVMELDPAFCDVIRTRYAEYVGDDRYLP